MTHGDAERLRTGLVLLERPWAPSQQLAGLPLAQPESRADRRHFGGVEHTVDLRLELLERLLAGDERIAGEDGFVALGTPPSEGLDGAGLPLVREP